MMNVYVFYSLDTGNLKLIQTCSEAEADIICAEQNFGAIRHDSIIIDPFEYLVVNGVVKRRDSL